MSIEAKQIINIMNAWAPQSLAESWDHPGLQIGNVHTPVKKVLVALDLTAENASYAADNGVNLIISHHPFLFRSLHEIDLGTYRGKIIETLIRSSIVSFAAHTNLDIARGGVNDVLAEKLSLSDVSGLDPAENGSDADSLGRTGMLPRVMSGKEAVSYIREKLEMPVIRYSGDINKNVKKIAILGGAGSEYIHDAKRLGADLFLTGDLKYHEAQEAYASDIIVVDGGHFYTEHPVVQNLANRLRQSFEEKNWDIEVVEDPVARDVFSYIG